MEMFHEYVLSLFWISSSNNLSELLGDFPENSNIFLKIQANWREKSDQFSGRIRKFFGQKWR